MKPSILICCALVALSACKRDKCEVSGNICTWAGVPLTAQFGPDGDLATESPLYLPQDVTFAKDGTAYIADFNNHRIRRVDVDGITDTVSGTGFLGDGPEGDAELAAWNHPTNLAIDPNDPEVLHVAAWHNSRVNLVDTAAGTVVFEAGTGGRDFAGDGGPAVDAILDLPSSVDFDDQGILYISDQANQLIRTIDKAGTIETIAGFHREPGYDGDGGPAADAHLFAEIGQAADPSSKLDVEGHMLYLADSGNNVIRVINLNSGIIDSFAGKQWTREGGAPADVTAGDGGKAHAARLNNPRDVAVGIDGEVYIADTNNNCVRVVWEDGTIETYAGKCGKSQSPSARQITGEAEPATDALLLSPYGVAVDHDGNLYIADTKNHVIRRVAR